LVGYNNLVGTRSKIYRNDNGTFIDINAALLGVGYCSLSWGDYDNDGDLDLVLAGDGGLGCVLIIYRNDNGTFIDINAGLLGVYSCSLSWGDYDNDGYLDLAVAGFTGSVYSSKIYKNNNGVFADINSGLPGVSNGCAISWGDYDNDGDLDIVLAGDTTSPAGASITKIFKSFESEFGNSNTVPNPPVSGFSSKIIDEGSKLQLTWDYGSDIETTQQKGLYYNIRVATQPIIDSLNKWIVSPSTGAGTGSGPNQNLGNYPHGFVLGTSAQPGFNLNSIREGTTYYWQARTIDTGLRHSAWSTVQSTYISNIPPTAPILLTPVNGSATTQVTIVFDWTDSSDTMSGIANYEVQISTDSIFRTVNYSSSPIVSIAQFPNLNSQLYYWRVRSKDNANNYSDWFLTWSIIIDTIPPENLGFLITVSTDSAEFNSIIANDNITGLHSSPYYVQMSTDNNIWGNYDSGWVSTFAYAGLSPDTTYWFRVKARDVLFNERAHVGLVTIKTLPLPVLVPQMPSNFGWTAVSTATIKFVWSDNSTNELGFRIYSSSNGLVKELPADTTEWYQTGLLPNTSSYVYYIKSFMVLESTTAATLNSVAWTVADLPTSVDVSTITVHMINLSWQDSGAKMYRLEISTDGINWLLFDDNITTTSYCVEGLKPGTTYQFSVKGYNSNNDLSVSSITLVLLTANIDNRIIDSWNAGMIVTNQKPAGTGVQNVHVVLDTGTVKAEVYIDINMYPLINPKIVNKDKIIEANNKLITSYGMSLLTGAITEFNMFYSTGSLFTGTFEKDVVIELTYLDANNDGLVDNVFPRLKAQTLKAYVLNETNSTWELIGGTVDTAAKKVTFITRHFSVYTLIGQKSGEPDLSGVKAYPTPYKPGSGGTLDRAGGILFDNLTSRANIKIFTMSGTLVFEDNETDGDGMHEWDTTNNDGQKVVSGVYIYVITDTDNKSDKAKGKIVIIK
jgi:hypothetical protein